MEWFYCLITSLTFQTIFSIERTMFFSVVGLMKAYVADYMIHFHEKTTFILRCNTLFLNIICMFLWNFVDS